MMRLTGIDARHVRIAAKKVECGRHFLSPTRLCRRFDLLPNVPTDEIVTLLIGRHNWTCQLAQVPRNAALGDFERVCRGHRLIPRNVQPVLDKT